jgi:DNA-binding NarL/FixJ family response regulator
MQRHQHAVAEPGHRVTVVLLDDEELIRTAVALALAESGLELVGEATNADDGVALVSEMLPDVVLVDLVLPGSSGVETIERLAIAAPASRIMVLTRSEQSRAIDAIIAGASGYLRKSAKTEAVIAAIRTTAAGDTAISPEVATQLLERVRAPDRAVTAAQDMAARAIRAVLTARELEIFACLASGNNNQRIAQDLGVSTNTVRNHIASILCKLHLENRIQAAVEAVRSGLA